MLYNTKASLISLQRGVGRSEEWSKKCFNLINSSFREKNIALSLELWKEVYACFRLDTYYSSDIQLCLEHMYESLSREIPLTHINLLEKLVTQQMPVLMSSLTVSPSKEVDRTVLKYSPIQQAFTIGHSHLEGNGVIINGLATERSDTFTLFSDDNSLGVFSPENEEIRCAVIPNTRFYSQYVLSQLGDRYIVLSPRNDLNLAGLQPLSENIFLYTTEEEIDIQPNPFPYRREYLSLNKMIENLRKSDDMNWYLEDKHYSLGIVVRDFDTTYDSADSISDIFSEEVRIACHEKGKLSPKNQWEVLEWKKIKGTTRDKRELVYSLSRGCNLFNCSLAVHIYRRFGGVGSRVLDPFAGYGDRMIGAYIAGCSEYFCYDTNPDLTPCYEEIAKTASKLNITSTILPFEKVIVRKIYKEYFDVALLSPPFFDYEIYEGKLTSTTLYSLLDQWIRNFWDVCIYKTLQFIRKGGFVVFYIPTGKDQISVKMNESVKRMCKDQEFYGTLGFTQTIRGIVRSSFVYRKLK